MQGRDVFTVGKSTTVYNSGSVVENPVYKQRDYFLGQNGNANGNRIQPNPHLIVGTIEKYHSGVLSLYSQTNPAVGYTTTGDSVVSSNYTSLYTPPDNLDYIYNRALENVVERIRGSIDLALMAAEGAKTAEMIRSMNRVKTYIAAINPKNIAKTFLQWKYGVKPLLQDVYNAASKIVGGSDSGRTKIRGRARERDKISYIGTPINGQPENCTCEWSHRVSLDLWYDFNPKMLASLAGWTSMNPASLVWETLPYSFVVDWFINVSGYIRCVETGYLYEQFYVSGTRTDTTNWIYRSEYDFDTDIGGLMKRLQANGKFRRYVKNRTVIGPPYPYAPSLKVDLGFSQMQSAVALIAVFLQGKR